VVQSREPIVKQPLKLVERPVGAAQVDVLTFPRETAGSSLRAACEALASDFVEFVDELELALVELRRRAVSLPLASPVATISGWQQTGRILDEEQERQIRILEGLRIQVAQDLRVAEGLVGRLRSAEDELRRAAFVIRPPFEEAAARLFRPGADAAQNGIEDPPAGHRRQSPQPNGQET
jgi:hypothetical protein